MFQLIKSKLKNERGLTLIELLAVVVILGIISAIAVPSIGGLIDNSKKDAHAANAQQMINSAKIAVAGNNNLMPNTAPVYLSLQYLIDEGYLDTMKDPDGFGYKAGENNSKSLTTKPTAGSYVVIYKPTTGNELKYSVKLITIATSPRGIQGSDVNKLPIPEENVNRSNVR